MLKQEEPLLGQMTFCDIEKMSNGTLAGFGVVVGMYLAAPIVREIDARRRISVTRRYTLAVHHARKAAEDVAVKFASDGLLPQDVKAFRKMFKETFDLEIYAALQI